MELTLRVLLIAALALLVGCDTFKLKNDTLFCVGACMHTDSEHEIEEKGEPLAEPALCKPDEVQVKRWDRLALEWVPACLPAPEYSGAAPASRPEAPAPAG